jgi:hypothetical protein
MIESLSLSVDVLKKYTSDLFYESGTYMGGGVQTALDAGFSNIISVETHHPFYNASNKLYHNNTKVKIILGDTISVMYNLLSPFSGKITFWLDGHIHLNPDYSESDCAFGEFKVPLLQELDIIKKLYRNDHIIMIDDRRMMGHGGVWGSITENDVANKLRNINDNYNIVYEDSKYFKADIIVASI